MVYWSTKCIDQFYILKTLFFHWTVIELGELWTFFNCVSLNRNKIYTDCMILRCYCYEQELFELHRPRVSKLLSNDNITILLCLMVTLLWILLYQSKDSSICSWETLDKMSINMLQSNKQQSPILYIIYIYNMHTSWVISFKKYIQLMLRTMLAFISWSSWVVRRPCTDVNCCRAMLSNAAWESPTRVLAPLCVEDLIPAIHYTHSSVEIKIEVVSCLRKDICSHWNVF